METMFTIAEISEKMNIPRSWFYQHISAGTLPFPHIKIGHFIRLRQSDIETYLQQQLITAERAAEARRKLREVK